MQLQQKGLKCKHLHKVLFIIFTLTGLQGLYNRLEHVHDSEYVHVVKGLRLHWIEDFKEFKGFLTLPLTGLKLRIPVVPVVRTSTKGKIYELTFIF